KRVGAYTDSVPPASSRPAHAMWSPPLGPRAVLVPVKAFGDAKGRLGSALGPAARIELARAMADRVLDAAVPLPVAVVCDDTQVAAWARRRRALVIWEPGRGLNGAVEAGVDHLTAAGVVHVTVAHADLPRAADLAQVGSDPGITLVPDRHGNGTNVIALPTGVGFRFSYGPGSFARHQIEAERLGVGVRILHRPDLAWDVDEPDDVVAAAPASARR
ncbi:MAG TPA: 2-phospho-L-lactate guanylyltransferase, partial [Acidimicrobiales bacterium]|nr:2-phospho-L-lactate guanylyltransferase [Acidimicrobiales bacterium]